MQQEKTMMIARNITVLTAIVISAIAIASTGSVRADSDARQSFTVLKGLEGKWAGKNQQGETIHVSFRTTGNGSAVMSEIEGHGADTMISMFHLDGDRLLLTHYCSAGNQPRLKMVSSDGKSLNFEFFDGTNIAEGAGHMQQVTFTQPDSDHHVEEWVFLDHGKELKQVFTLERVK